MNNDKIKVHANQEILNKMNTQLENSFFETKVWLISILMITKEGLELMIIFQV